MKQGDRLAEWRLRETLSQEEAAAKISVSQSAWAAWESGSKVPGLQSAVAIESLTKGEIAAASWTEPRKSTRKLRRVVRKPHRIAS